MHDFASYIQVGISRLHLVGPSHLNELAILKERENRLFKRVSHLKHQV